MESAPTPALTLILGAGLSGLMAAWQLRRRGQDVEVWEAAAAPGGWAQTLVWPGPQGEPGFLERGPNSLRFHHGGALDHLLRDLDLPMRVPGPRGPRWLGKEGRRYPGPTTMGGLWRVPGLSVGEKLRMLAEPFMPAGHDPEESLQDVFARRLGSGFARELLPALTAGLFAAPPDRIGMEALPRLQRMEQQGGLLLGALRAGPPRTRIPEGGLGALSKTLCAQLGCVRLNQPARALEPLPRGRWRIHGEGRTRDADAVVLALPPRPAAALLKPLAPACAAPLESIPSLDLRVWHSRYAMVPGWERGIGLLIHPPEGRGLLGLTSLAADDPRGVPGLLQIRAYLGGAYTVDADLESWPGVWAELRRWLPELGDPIQVREENCPGAFPLMTPGHGACVAGIRATLPPNLHWIGAARFGPGVPDLAEGIEAWAQKDLFSLR